MLDLPIEIAGLAARLCGAQLPAAACRRIQAHYAGFTLGPAARSGAIPQIDLRLADGDPFLPFDSDAWQVRSWLEAGRVHFVSHLESGWFDLVEGRGELTLRPNGNPENYLRVIYAWRCLNAGALLVHAGGVICDGRGWAFFGPSGAGKTTAVSLSPGACVLSDDLVILKSERAPAQSGSAGVRVYGTPFRGDLPETPRQNASAELAGLFALEKAAEHAVAPLAAPLALARLAACIPFVMVQPASAGRALALCGEIVRRRSPQLLRFRRDPGFWSVINGG